MNWLLGFIFLFSQSIFAQDVQLVEIRGTIDPATSHYLGRAIDHATQNQAQLLLVELDTPGGLVTSVREMAQKIDQSKIPVVVYTSPGGASATSAGALLMISSHLAAMAPGTNIGAAHPVGAQGEEIKGPMGEKAVNDISAFARAMADLRKRNIKAANEVVSKSNSYSAEEALKAHLIEVIAADHVALWKAIDKKQVQVGENKIILKTQPEPQVHRLEMTVGEKILHYLAHPNVAAILMTLGILFIYAELNVPGVGIAGVLGGLCLIIAFMTFQVLPIQMGGMILLGLGVILIIAEIFVTSHGALAGGGTLAFILGLLWVMDPEGSDLRISPWVIASTGGVLFAGVLLIGFSVANLGKVSAAVLKKIGGGDSAGVQGYQGRVHEVSSDGLSGRVFIRGEYWNFFSQVPLKENDLVFVKNVSGLKLEVELSKE